MKNEWRVVAARAAGIVLLLGLLLSCSGSSDGKVEGLPSRPHPLIVVVLDGVRADSLEALPSVASLASEAVRLDWAFAQAPDAWASLASALTGLYPTTHGLVEPGEELSDDALTVAELLTEAGLTASAFIETETDAGRLGLQQGFADFEVGPGALDDAAAWLESNSGKNYFLLAFTDAVSAAMGRAGSDEAGAVYEENLAALDSRLRNWFATLARVDPDRSATVVLLSTRGSEPERPGAAVAPTLHAAWTHAPWMIRLPRGSSAQRIDRIVELVDLAPTLLELTGTTVPAEMQGTSLRPLIEGAGTPPYVAFGESPHGGGQQYAALGGYQMVLYKEDDRAELYELRQASSTATDIAASESKRVEVLRDYLSAWEKMTAAASLDPDRRIEQLDDATLEQLKSLGYIQ